MAQKKRMKQINLIPLINIIFLMLIFFMLAGTITKIDPYKICLHCLDRLLHQNAFLSLYCLMVQCFHTLDLDHEHVA